MKTATTMTSAERIGRSLGRGWREITRAEASLIQRFSGNRLCVWGARSLLITIKVALVILLLFVSIWLALLVAVVLTMTTLSTRSFLDNQTKAELRDGHSGVGVYDQNDWRIDPVDNDDL